MTLVVTDSKGNSDEQDVTVKVTNIEEDGDGHASPPCSRGIGFPVTATLADPDNVDCGQCLLAVAQGHCDARTGMETTGFARHRVRRRYFRRLLLSRTQRLTLTRQPRVIIGKTLEC